MRIIRVITQGFIIITLGIWLTFIVLYFTNDGYERTYVKLCLGLTAYFLAPLLFTGYLIVLFYQMRFYNWLKSTKSMKNYKSIALIKRSVFLFLLLIILQLLIEFTLIMLSLHYVSQGLQPNNRIFYITSAIEELCLILLLVGVSISIKRAIDEMRQLQ